MRILQAVVSFVLRAKIVDFFIFELNMRMNELKGFFWLTHWDNFQKFVSAIIQNGNFDKSKMLIIDRSLWKKHIAVRNAF